MIGSIYNGMSGLQAFSKGLDTISSNISNMNTPGFKSSELQFLDVFYQSQYSSKQNGQVSSSQSGSGVSTGGTSTRFNQGELRSTGQDLDVAIDGNGFFVMRKDNQTLYTRAGQLQFDEKGFLVSRQNNARIAALDANGNLLDINQASFLTQAQLPTSEVSFKGILTVDRIDPNIPPHHEIDAVIVDALGEERTLRIEFDLLDITTLEWGIEVFDGTTSLASGSVRYQPGGEPLAGSNTFEFTLAAADGSESKVNLNMGEPDSPTASSSRSFGTSSTLNVNEIDGYEAGNLQSTSINAKGILISQYSNNETVEHAQLALASFLQLQDLQQQSGSVFVASDDIQPVLGYASDIGFGSIASRTVELSNVDLTQQFGDLIIVQRGYQASSQILTVSNEMLQQLIEMRGR